MVQRRDNNVNASIHSHGAIGLLIIFFHTKYFRERTNTHRNVNAIAARALLPLSCNHVVLEWKEKSDYSNISSGRGVRSMWGPPENTIMYILYVPVSS